jgi:hypothetical protein
MGILDELRLKANEKKDAQEQQESQEQLLASNYKHLLLPKMQHVFSYLNEVVANLNFLAEPIVIKDYSPRYPQLGELRQQNYRINTDGFGGLADFNRLTQINLTFSLIGEGFFSYTIEGKRIIEQELAFLHARDLPFEWKHIPGKAGIMTAAFVLQRKIPVRFRIEVVYDKSQLLLTIDNHEDFSVYSKTLEADDATDDLLESVAGYLLRRNCYLTRLEISEQHLQNIRDKLNTLEHEKEVLLAQIKQEESAKPRKQKK